MLSPIRRAATRRRDIPRPSRSDSVKIRHFTGAARDSDDCSFATLTLPFQRTSSRFPF